MKLRDLARPPRRPGEAVQEALSQAPLSPVRKFMLRLSAIFMPLVPALIACGLMVNIALEAAEQLAGYGVSARVVNMPTIKPLDNDLVLDCARTIGKIVTCEEHSVIGGLGSAVCELTSRMCPVPVSRLGVNDVFGKSGDVPGLFEEYGLTAAHIVKKVNSLLA